MLRLLFVCNDFDYFMRHWYDRAYQAALGRYEVAVAVPLPGGNTSLPLEDTPFQWFGFEMKRQSINPFKELRSVWLLRRILCNFSPNLIHSCTVKPNIYVSLASLGKTIPQVMSVTGLGTMFNQHGKKYRLVQSLILKTYALLTKGSNTWLMFENEDDRRLFLRWGAGSKKRNILVRGAGVNVNLFTPKENANDPCPLIVFAARMLWDKGAGDFVAAAEKLSAAKIEARFALVGGTDTASRGAVPESQLKEWHNKGVVEWWGYCANMEEILNQAHVVCLPTCYREGVPRVLIEAAACGRPLVATDTPGCRDIVHDKENGFLVQCHDVSALASALKRLILDGNLRRKFGRESRRIAEADYTREIVIEHTLDVYNRALQCHGL